MTPGCLDPCSSPSPHAHSITHSFSALSFESCSRIGTQAPSLLPTSACLSCSAAAVRETEQRAWPWGEPRRRHFQLSFAGWEHSPSLDVLSPQTPSLAGAVSCSPPHCPRSAGISEEQHQRLRLSVISSSASQRQRQRQTEAELQLSCPNHSPEANKHHRRKLDPALSSCLWELSLTGIVPRPWGGELEQHCGTELPKRFWRPGETPHCSMAEGPRSWKDLAVASGDSEEARGATASLQGAADAESTRREQHPGLHSTDPAWEEMRGAVAEVEEQFLHLAIRKQVSYR